MDSSSPPPAPRSIPAWAWVSAGAKLVLLPIMLWVLALDRPWAATGLIALISAIAFLERLGSDLPGRVVSAMSNRAVFIPALVFLALRQYSLEAHFPILMVLGSAFIVAKELLFIAHDWKVLFYSEDYNVPGGSQKVNSLALLTAVILYTLSLEPWNNIAMIAVIVISTAEFGGFLWNTWKKRRGIKDLNLATRITLLRLLMSPAFLIVYFYDRNPDFSDNSLTLQVTAVLLAVFFVVTDGLDGYFARKRNEVTKFGKFLDPFSDKICTMTVFLCFVASNYVPVWMVALVFYRETAVDTIRTLAAAENVVISARPSGKWKTALQGTVIITVLILATTLSTLAGTAFPSLYPDLYADLLVAWNYIPFAFMALVTLVTVVSGIDYVLASRDILDKYFK